MYVLFLFLPQTLLQCLYLFLFNFSHTIYIECFFWKIFLYPAEQVRVRGLDQGPSKGSLAILGPSDQQSNTVTTRVCRAAV